jgi:hypothetical protein
MGKLAEAEHESAKSNAVWLNENEFLDKDDGLLSDEIQNYNRTGPAMDASKSG